MAAIAFIFTAFRGHSNLCKPDLVAWVCFNHSQAVLSRNGHILNWDVCHRRLRQGNGHIVGALDEREHLEFKEKLIVVLQKCGI